MNSLDWCIGLKVKITTILDKSFQGKVYAFDQITNMLALELDDNSVRLFKSTFIKDINVLEKQKKSTSNNNNKSSSLFSQAKPSIGPISINSLKKRERQQVEQRRKVYLAKGVNVSKEAQFVFDSLHKTLPCRWNGKSIIVFDEVTVNPPYTPESCKGGNDKVLAMVRQHVLGALEKLELKGG